MQFPCVSIKLQMGSQPVFQVINMFPNLFRTIPHFILYLCLLSFVGCQHLIILLLSEIFVLHALSFYEILELRRVKSFITCDVHLD
jgi:uncharacterized membrane protein YecN with MAPEG domain